MKYLDGSDPNTCTDIGLHNFGGQMFAGASVRCVAHYRQIYEAKRFQYYDFGEERNMKEYGQSGPPEIDLQAFSDMDIGLFCGKTDYHVMPGDYHWLRDSLKKNNNLAYFKDYNLGHTGLLIPKDKTVFYDMLALLKKFASPEHADRFITPPNQEAFSKAEAEMESICSQIKKM